MDRLLEVEVWTISRLAEGNSILLRCRESDVIIPLFINENEIKALLYTENLESEQTSIYTVFAHFALRCGLSLARVELYELKDERFQARLIFTGGNYTESAPLVLEARPADAIVLAQGAKSRIYVSQDTMERIDLRADDILAELCETKENHERS